MWPITEITSVRPSPQGPGILAFLLSFTPVPLSKAGNCSERFHRGPLRTTAWRRDLSPRGRSGPAAGPLQRSLPRHSRPLGRLPRPWQRHPGPGATLGRRHVHGPLGPIRWRFGHQGWETLADVLANPDGEAAYRARAEQHRAQARHRWKAAAWPCPACGRTVHLPGSRLWGDSERPTKAGRVMLMHHNPTAPFHTRSEGEPQAVFRLLGSFLRGRAARQGRRQRRRCRRRRRGIPSRMRRPAPAGRPEELPARARVLSPAWHEVYVAMLHVTSPELGSPQVVPGSSRVKAARGT
jgi:hypothetical protein